jgi:glycosyltransferase involved in cell wall biosynthesis
MNPSFSICIPNFNYARYIGLTIASVLQQTYDDFEIIVVDNASTDESVAVVESFHSPKIRLFRNPYNVGFAPNLDRAASKAEKLYIIVLSSDDLMHPTALEEYARVILEMGAESRRALICSAVDLIDGNGDVFGQKRRRESILIEPESEHPFQFSDPEVAVFRGLRLFQDVFPRMSVPGPFCSTMYSRELYDSVGGYSSTHQIGPDAHFAYKVLLQDAWVVSIDRLLFAYRIHQQNQVSQNWNRQSMKVPVDRYLFTLQYSDTELASAGLSRSAVVEALTDEACLNASLASLRAGSWYYAFRLLMFGLATYPGAVLKNGKSYAAALLLALGPGAPPVTRSLYALRKLVSRSPRSEEPTRRENKEMTR